MRKEGTRFGGRVERCGAVDLGFGTAGLGLGLWVWIWVVNVSFGTVIVV